MKNNITVTITRIYNSINVEFCKDIDGTKILLFNKSFQRWFGLLEPSHHTWNKAKEWKEKQMKLINKFSE